MEAHETIDDLKEQLASQARLFEERLSAIKASRENTVGLQAAPTGGDQPSQGVESAGTKEEAGFAPGRRFRVATDSLLQTIGGDVDIPGGSSLSIGSRKTSSIKSSVPKFNGSGVEYPLWKRRFQGDAITSGCMQAFTTVADTMVGDPSVTSRFVLDQGCTEISVKRSRLAWTCITESITDRELLSRVFDTNSPSVAWRMLNDWFLPKTPVEKSKWKRQLNDLVMEKKGEPMKILARVDIIVGVLGSLGVHLLTEDVNLQIVDVLTDDYEFKQRTILCRDNITRAEIEAIVRQRHTIMSRGASTKVRNVGQTRIENMPGRRNRKQEVSGKGGRAGRGVSDDVVAAVVGVFPIMSYEGREVRRHAKQVSLILGARSSVVQLHRARHPCREEVANGSGEIIGCLAIGMLGERDTVGEREQGMDGTEKWIADSGVTLQMTRSADLLRDMQPSEDKARIGNDTLVDVEGYGSLTVVFPNKAEGVTVRLEKVAYVPSSAFNPFPLMAAHTRGVGFAIDDKDRSVTPADGRLKFGVMDLDTVTMIEGFIPMTTTSFFPCWFPNPSRTSCNLLTPFPWSFQ